MSLTKVLDDLQLTANFIRDFVCVCNGKCVALTLTEVCYLRANPPKRHFARNRELEFTGKSPKSPFYP